MRRPGADARPRPQPGRRRPAARRRPPVRGRGGRDRRRGPTTRHEVTGAKALDGLFGEAVCEPIALHVAAKRYLCFVEPAYYDRPHAGLPGLAAAAGRAVRRGGGGPVRTPSLLARGGAAAAVRRDTGKRESRPAARSRTSRP
ncbi:MAG: hypothetical protein WDM92_12730 [Caulobacteraceae bacterium]